MSYNSAHPFEGPVGRKMLGTTSSNEREAEGGEDGLFWRFDKGEDASQMVYTLIPEQDLILTFEVNVATCSRVDQHLANHRSAWKSGQQQFISYLRNRLEHIEDRSQVVRTRDLLHRTERLECPIIDSAIFHSVLVTEENVIVECDLVRQFEGLQFYQAWQMTDEGFVLFIWQQKVQHEGNELTFTGTSGRVSLELYLCATPPNASSPTDTTSDTRLGEHEIFSGRWRILPDSSTEMLPVTATRIQLIDDNALVFHLDSPVDQATLDGPEGSSITLRLSGITIETPTSDWDLPFYPQGGQIASSLSATIGEYSHLLPPQLQIPAVYTGDWSPMRRQG